MFVVPNHRLEFSDHRKLTTTLCRSVGSAVNLRSVTLSYDWTSPTELTRRGALILATSNFSINRLAQGHSIYCAWIHMGSSVLTVLQFDRASVRSPKPLTWVVVEIYPEVVHDYTRLIPRSCSCS